MEVYGKRSYRFDSDQGGLGMGMEVTTTPAAASSDPYTKRTKQDIKNECGSLAANKTMSAIRIQKAKSTKKKKLNYNYIRFQGRLQ